MRDSAFRQRASIAWIAVQQCSTVLLSLWAGHRSAVRRGSGVTEGVPGAGNLLIIAPRTRHRALFKKKPRPPRCKRRAFRRSLPVSTTATSETRRSRGHSCSRSPGGNTGARFGTRESDLDTPPPLAPLAPRTSGGTDQVFVLA